MRKIFALVVLLCSALQLSAQKQETILKDTVIMVPAHPELGFNFPYYVRIPKGIPLNQSSYLLVETNNTGNNDTLAFHEAEALKQIKRNSLGASLCSELKTPFLMPVFPRSATHWEVYTHALDRDAILIKDGDDKRLDLQLLAMINHAKEVLNGFQIPVQDKVFMNGFSASGTFANRFTFIHPERVAAVACGGINAFPMLPVSRMNKTMLNYPLGLADFEKLFGFAFKQDAYRKVPQIIYMGAKDTNDAVLYDDAYSKQERKIVLKLLTDTLVPTRFERCSLLYAEQAPQAQFKVYPNIGHETDMLVFQEVSAFFKNAMLFE
jgi:hypothetical protein